MSKGAASGGERLLGHGDATENRAPTVRNIAHNGLGWSLTEAARRNKEAELARAAEMAAEAAASGVDEDAVFDSTSVRPLRQLRPVPPLHRAAARDLAKPVPPLRPVYDPFSARRRQTPDWLVRYTASLVAVDLAAVVIATVAALVLAGTSTAAVATARSSSACGRHWSRCRVATPSVVSVPAPTSSAGCSWQVS